MRDHDSLLTQFLEWRKLHPKLSGLPLEEWWAERVELGLYLHNAASLEVLHYQWFNDGTESGSTSVTTEDTSADLDVDTVYHLRVTINDTNNGAENNTRPQLQYNLNGGGWNDVNATSSVVQSAAGGLVEDGDTTERLTTPSGSTFITPNSGQDEVDGLAGGNNDMDFIDGVNDHAEAVYSVQILSGDVVDNDSIDFRITVGGTPITNTVTPNCTVNEPAGAAPPLFVVQGQKKTEGGPLRKLLRPTSFIRPGLNIVKLEAETVDLNEEDLRFVVAETVQLILWRKTGVDPRPDLELTSFIRPEVEAGSGELQLSGFRIDLEYTPTTEVAEPPELVQRTGERLERTDLEPTSFTRPDVVSLIIKVEGEAVDVSESDITVLGLVRLQAETVEISEADLTFVVRKIVEFIQSTTGGPGALDLEPSKFIRPGLNIIKLEAEIIELNEQDLSVLGLVRIEDETVEITEADLRFLVRALDYLVNRTGIGPRPDLEPTHFIRPGLVIVKVEDDIVEVSEADLHYRGLTKIQDETEEISEADLSVLGKVKLHDETVEVSEADLSFVIQKIVQFVQRTTGGSLLEELEPTQFIRPGLVLVKIEDEAVEIFEADIRLLGLVRLEDETEEISEADLTKITKVITELVRRTGGLTRPGLGVSYFVRPDLPSVLIIKVEDETVEIAEDDLTVLGFVRVQDETVEISESDLSFVIQRIVDFVQRSGDLTRPDVEPTFFIRPDGVVLIVKVEDETIEISETDIGVLGLVRQTDETIQIAEEDIRVRVLTRVEGETVQISEAELSTRDLARIQSETIQIVEQSITARGLVREGENVVVQVSEQDLHVLGRVKVFGESVEITEADISVVGAIIPTPDFITIDLVVSFRLRDAVPDDSGWRNVVPDNSGLRDLRVER